MKRHRDPVAWIYDHRAGVFSLVALALVMAILFIGSRIVIRTSVPGDGIVVDLHTVEELQQEAERLQREVRLRQSEADLGDIRNAISNEGAELRNNTDMASLRSDIDRTNQGLKGNRDAWDQGMREIEQMRGGRNGGDAGDKNSNNDSRKAGKVLVAVSVLNPTRHYNEDDIKVPGYRSENSGEVVVDITVGPGGNVVAAKVNNALSDSDPRMRQTALEAARLSQFSIDHSAPERHTGTITYSFVAQ